MMTYTEDQITYKNRCRWCVSGIPYSVTVAANIIGKDFIERLVTKQGFISRSYVAKRKALELSEKSV